VNGEAGAEFVAVEERIGPSAFGLHSSTILGFAYSG
jgi:hypothetical protein